MQQVIISDTSCLILLDKIRELDLLHNLYGTVLTTRAVANEFRSPLPDWILIDDPKAEINYIALRVSLGKGEASAIALALEYDQSILIIDELRGRRIAMQLGLNITGTFGIPIEAKKAGLLSSVKTVLAKIKKTDFYILNSLNRQSLRWLENEEWCNKN